VARFLTLRGCSLGPEVDWILVIPYRLPEPCEEAHQCASEFKNIVFIFKKNQQAFAIAGGARTC
jgi:hypothetical protein